MVDDGLYETDPPARYGGFPNALYRDWWLPLYPTSCFSIGVVNPIYLAQCLSITTRLKK
jgi:hypothetical protein